MTNSAFPLFQLPNTYRAFYGTFSQLHPVQRQVIAPILQGEDLILQARTGSGKTEAVLAPCLERVIQSQRAQAVLYIVPTRALALDLERRLAPVFERLGLRFSIRTGDTKRTGGDNPDLLLTTPESLDVALGSSNADLRRFIQRIRMVIIDEVHPLVHSYRGKQLVYLLRRLKLRSVAPLQKIALSATIADIETVIRFFNFRSNTIRLITPVQRIITPYLVHLKNETQELVALLDDCYEVWNYRKVLIFANSRGGCDRLFELLNRQGSFRGVCELHYSNLKTKERRGVEQRFRCRKHSLCIATSTLELGIDIGDVDGVLLYEPPDSVSAFLQRIGRANRRQAQINFWGICRGEQAGSQLLRFLGLLRLARESRVEPPLPKRLPSVLIQQILSCLYEKKQISLPALQNLFPDTQATLEDLFEAMLTQRWLRKDHVEGLFRGSVRYRDSLLERKIWSNFPETEEDYVLELSGEAIADLPVSVVRQLEVGDRVQLAGKRIQVLQIDAGARKHLVAQPTEQLDEKELFWIGAGFQVSFEVSQSIRDLLKNAAEIEEDQTLKLFARPRKLWEEELRRSQQVVKLANGIEVGRQANGLYQYRTFLGSLGNLLLHWTIEHQWRDQEDLVVTSDEIGIDCSQLIDFQKLHLPIKYEDFQEWVKRHVRALCAVFSLNAFSFSLPAELLVQEVTDFIFDPRIAEAFAHFLHSSSEIVEGDSAVLEWQIPESEQRTSVFLETKGGKIPLLVWEKQRWAAKQLERFLLNPNARHSSRALTGTLVGEYFQHEQCERWLSFSFLPTDQQPPLQKFQNTEIQQMRMERGRQHEAQTLSYLQSQKETLIVIEETDSDRKLLSLQQRFEVSLEQLKKLIEQIRAVPQKSFIVSQAVLILPGLLDQEKTGTHPINGVGIPDLIRISMSQGEFLLEVGDIKASRSPQYSQKWQVAFYAMLLETLIHLQILPIQGRVSPNGFLLTPSADDTMRLEHHHFTLEPYRATFSVLFQNIKRTLLQPPSEAVYRLQNHCSVCPYYTHCYQEALDQEDILLLPQLTTGVLQKLRSLHLKTMDTASEWFDQADASMVEVGVFSPDQEERLAQRLTALRMNQIAVKEQKTRMFPDNLSIAIFFHLIEDPVTASPRGLGWQVLDQTGTLVENQRWIIAADHEFSEVWQEFSEQFLQIWTKGINGRQGPHLFHFGGRSWQALQEWKKTAILDFLWEPEISYRTDLRQLIARHFDFPIPGRLTLFALGQLLGLNPELEEPESLFHPDSHPIRKPRQWGQDKVQYEQMEHYLQTILSLQTQIWQWVTSHLRSEWEQSWRTTAITTHSPERIYQNFIMEEQRLREEDILSLQTYSLQERVERFRAIGPLTFSTMSLDDEGHFLYDFQRDFQQELEVSASKFREGDFLKLVPVGTMDLQSGMSVILVNYDRKTGQLQVRSRQRQLALNKRIAYSLEEDSTDWNSSKLTHLIQTVFNEERPHPLAQLFSGEWELSSGSGDLQYIENWLRTYETIVGLNPAQQQALMLPFRSPLCLIEGPPGTGKTHLLGWILITLIQHAHQRKIPLRIVVSALTHQAIDHVLAKVVGLVNQYDLSDFPGECFKWGRWGSEEQEGERQVKPLNDREELSGYPYLILGATGFGLYQLFGGEQGKFPQIFDWVVFDEASQVLVPQALLSLIYGKRNFLFLGDVKQLPPIILGHYPQETETPAIVQHSILSLLLDRYDQSQRIRLNQTYRMNQELCAFPSQMWYEGQLQPASSNAHTRLELHHFRRNDWLDQVLAPEQPLALLLVEHRHCHQKSDLEAEIVARLAYRLMAENGLRADQLALISPHRTQNNAITDRLSQLFENESLEYPLIDTVERVQGAEREVIIFSLTTSDPDHIESEFLNNPNRFNVAITRAKQKLIVVGSHAFFSMVARSEETLQANHPFKAFLQFCQEYHCVYQEH